MDDNQFNQDFTVNLSVQLNQLGLLCPSNTTSFSVNGYVDVKNEDKNITKILLSCNSVPSKSDSSLAPKGETLPMHAILIDSNRTNIICTLVQ